MIEIEISPEMLTEAKINVKKYNDHNLFGGAYAQKLAGEIGRLAFRFYLQKHGFKFVEDTHIGSKDEFDFIVEGQNVSLKTQLINFPPQPQWRCEVFIGQIENPCDYYVFAKCHLRGDMAYLCGCISKEEFDRISIVREAGAVLDDNFTPWAVKETKRDVTINELHSLDILQPLF